jgi:hypothetical protein
LSQEHLLKALEEMKQLGAKQIFPKSPLSTGHQVGVFAID